MSEVWSEIYASIDKKSFTIALLCILSILVIAASVIFLCSEQKASETPVQTTFLKELQIFKPNKTNFTP